MIQTAVKLYAVSLSNIQSTGEM